jgi:peptidoglycan hydrolase-like protein with peptidoglycan-binding domain
MRTYSSILINLTASALIISVACGHTRTVGDNAPAGDTPATAATNATPPADAKRAAPRTSKKDGDKNPGVVVDGDEGALPLATSPAGLLKPNAIESIQEKLASGGRLSKDHETGKLDQPTRNALRDFQRANNLPATGMPDDVTIQKLGLGTKDIFRAAEAPAKEADRPK